jgi:hypothetical protein
MFIFRRTENIDRVIIYFILLTIDLYVEFALLYGWMYLYTADNGH